MKLIWKYLKKYKKYILLNFVSVIGFVLIEIGIPTLLATGINNQFHGLDSRYMLSLALGMVAFAVIGLALLLLLAYSTNRMVTAIVRDLRNDIFDQVQRFSHEEYEQFGISRLITNTVSDCYIIMQFLTAGLRTGLIAPTLFLASFVMIFLRSPSLALVTLASLPVMMLCIWAINRRTRPLSTAQQKGLDSINLNMRESLTGLRVIRAFNNEDFQEGRFDKINDGYATLSRKMFQTVALVSPMFSVIFSVLMAVVMQMGAGQVDAFLLEYGTLAAFIEYVFHALFSFLMLSTVFMMYPRTAVAAHRIQELFDAQPGIYTPENPHMPEQFQGVLEFDNVSFAYSDAAEEKVLENISFTATPGQTVAFIGSTGSGKSTLVQLIPRFFDVTHGRVTIDGVDIRDMDVDLLRQQIGYVPQRALLFSGTIAENLRFGKDDATQAQLEHAASIAQAHDFIAQRPEGYEDILSEGGINLSGGQKQRLCIARALVRKPPIYVFDDSFSALDYKTDATLRRRLAPETRHSTVLIVAQRVGTIMDADKIIVIDKGNIVGQGTHRELLKDCQIYYEIASSQLSKEELER